MKNSTTMSSKGRVTVPQEILNRLGLSAGDRIEFVVEGGRTLIRPVRLGANPFAKYNGALKTLRSRKQIRAWTRELRDEKSAG